MLSNQRSGQIIGNYKLLGVLGEGGMGVVYKAEHTMLGRRVALKMLLSEYAEQEDIVERFFTEAKAVNRIGHKNIIDIIDYGLTPDNCPYFIMELLEGEELAKLMDRQGAIEAHRAINIVRQVASALEASHAQGILHRDLKPENIFILPRQKEPEFVKVLDFGIAKLIEKKGDATLTSKTKTGVVIGTPQYMAPEQVRKKPLDSRTDQYALGLVFYEMLTGSQPFMAENFPDLVVKMLTEPLVKPSERNPLVQAPLEAVVIKMLERKQEDRYPSMADFLLALDEAEQQLTKPTGDAGALPRPHSAQPIDSRPTVLTPAPVQNDLISASIAETSPRTKNPTTLSLSAAEAPNATKKSPLWIVAALAVSGGALLVFLLMPSATAGAPPALAPTPATKAAEVEITFLSEQGSAQVFDGEHLLGALPYTVHMPFSTRPTSLLFKKDGYETTSQSFAPNADQTFTITFASKTPAAPTTALSTPNPKPEETPKNNKRPKTTEKQPEQTPAPTKEPDQEPVKEPVKEPTKTPEGKPITPCFIDPNQAHCKK